MHEQLASLDELVLGCRSEQSKEYIIEAVRCYRAGAFRACIINTWLAIVFDLIEKIRELHLSDNAKASSLYAKFETYQNQLENGSKQGISKALEFERYILSNVNKELGFFNALELVDLKRLHEDRNKCAHPSYQTTVQTFFRASKTSLEKCCFTCVATTACSRQSS